MIHNVEEVFARDSAAGHGSLYLRAASANVCTWNSSKFSERGTAEGCMISTVTSLEMLFNKSKFDIVGVQEGCTKGDQIISGIFYNMFVAGTATNGTYGSQIWIHRSLPYTVQSSLVVSCRVIVLSIKVHGRYRVLHCVSAHAPHSGRVSEACTFWFDLLRVVKNL